MTAFVEKGDDVVMRENGGLAGLWRREIAGEIHNGRADRVVAAARIPFAGYTCAALVALAGVEIEVQMAQNLVVIVDDGECANIGVPRTGVDGFETNVEQAARDFEQTFQNLWLCEKLFDLVFGVGIAFFTQLL